MDNQDISVGVREVIAMNSRFTFDEIETSKKIEKYISADNKARLAREIKRKFDKIKTTKLTNALFSTVVKVQDLIDHVKSYYKKDPATNVIASK